MKKIILMLFVVSVFMKQSHAQCDKKILWTSGKQAFTNSKDEVQSETKDKITVEVSNTAIIFNHNDDPNDVMKGTVKEVTCNWTDAFKNGKTVIKAELTEGHNDTHDAVVIIEGKDGLVTIILQLNDKPDMKIKAFADKYEEKN